MSNPLSARLVAFYGDELIAIQDEDGTIFAVFTRLCDNLGLGRESQVRRIRRHAILNEGLVTRAVETSGGSQTVQCLRADLLPLWLSGIQSDRVKDEDIRSKLIRYQREAAQVLWQAFRHQILTEDVPLAPENAQAITDLERIVEQSKAMQRMAEEQIALIMRMDAAARVVKEIKADVTDVQVRLGVLEDRLSPKSLITDAQAAQIQKAVQTIAFALTRRDPSKNYFQSIHAELHDRFGVTSYKLIQQEQYPAVLTFLKEWNDVSRPGEPKQLGLLGDGEQES